ncbi:MAG TPA: hypothetical protein PKH07_12680, partial [bacterium]|nr:hypothetical protein [bacterium]
NIDRETGLNLHIDTRIDDFTNWDFRKLEFVLSAPTWKVEMLAPFLQNLSERSLPISGQGSLEGQINGEGKGSCAVAVREMSIGESFRANVEASFRDITYRRDTGQLGASLRIGCKDMRLSNLEAQQASFVSDLEYSTPDGRFQVRDAVLAMDSLNASMNLTGSLDGNSGELMNAGIRFEELPLEYLMALLGILTDRFGSINGTEGECFADLKMSVVRMKQPPGTKMTVSGTVGLTGSSGSGYEDMLIWSDLGARWDGELESQYSIGDEPEASIRGTASLEDGEFLYDTLYHDLKVSPIDISVQSVVKKTGMIKLQSGALRIPKTLEVQAHGDVQAASPLSYDLVVNASASLDKFLPDIVASWLSGGSDRFNHASATGQTQMELAVVGDATNTFLDGQIHLHAQTLDLPMLKELHMENLVAEIPFRIHRGALAKTRSSDVPLGEIRFDRLSQTRMNIGRVRIPLHVQDNVLNIPQPISVSIWDGQIHLNEFQMENILDRYSKIYGRGRVEDLALPLLTEWLAWPAVDGTLSCDRLEMQSEGGALKLLYPLTADVFGGLLVIEEMQWLDYLERFPKLKMSMEIRQIDLGQLSSRFPIGQIRGVLTGHVRELIFQAGLPTRFDIELETESRARSQQQISVEAIKTILMVDPRTLRDQAVRQLLERTEMVYYSKIG